MLVRLFDPVMQFQTKSGALNTAGLLVVYLEGTDDLAQIYSDEEGHVPLSQPVILDNNGRSRGLYVESGVKYRLAVRTNHGALLFTVRNMVPVDGQSLSASLPLKIEGGTITNNGTGITCTGEYAWAEGHNTTASGEHSHAEGSETIASGANTHAEGAATKATHPHAHAEGFHTEATATSAHAEGSGAKATTTIAHAEGQDTVASGDASHAQGRNSVASGAYSHASGYGTRATGQGSHAVGKYNDDGSALFVVGNGSGPNQRKDVFKVDANGNTWVEINGVLTKIVSVEDDHQYVLFRSDMSAPFTDEEYNTCISETNSRHSVVVQFGSGGLAEAQLIQIKYDGALVFSRCLNDTIVTYTVAPGSTHTIYISMNQIPHPESRLSVKLGGTTKVYTPTGPDVSLDVDDEVSRIYLAKGSASVAALNGGIAGIQNGWSYVLKDSGTLTDGNVSVVAGDNVAWDGSAWFKVGNQVTPNVLFAVQTPEYVLAITDSNGVLLFAIKKDGSVDWAKGIPDQIKLPLEQIFATLPTKVDSVAGKGLIDSTFSNEISVLTNDEYLLAIVDSNDRILFSIDKSGRVDFQSGLPDALAGYIAQLANKVDKESGKSLVDTTFANGVSTEPDLSEYAFVITDDNDRVLLGIDNNGTIEGKFQKGETQFFNTVADMMACDNPNLRFAVTMGFYSVGDGGAAKYVVGAGTPNGFSSFRLKSGLVAKLVIEENYLYPEQVGYTNTDTSKDLRTYLFYITRDLLIDTVRFYNRRYYQNGPWIVPRQGISLIGSCNSGNQQNDGIYYFTRIFYSSTRTDDGACVFNCEYREFRLENIEIRNLDASDPSKPPRIGIYTLKFNDDPSDPDYHKNNHYDMILRNVVIGEFEYGLNLTGNIKWNLQIDNVRCNSCTYGCRIFGHVLVAAFKLFYPDHCKVGILIDTLSVAVSFLYCNFGTVERCIVFENGIESSPYGQYTFVGCNFELDAAPTAPRPALFLDIEESYRAMITMIGCNFNFGLIGQSQYTNQCFCFKLSEQTELTMIGCQQSDPRWNDQLFNPAYPAKKKLGSIKVINSENIVRPNYTAEYLPTMDIDGSIITDSLQVLEQDYPDAAPGSIVYDQTADKAYIKLLNTYKEV